MIPFILILFSLVAVLFMATIGVVIFFHFKRFTPPKDQFAKRILNIFEIGSLFIVLLNIILLALNILKK
ncbi:hypothetical protein KJA15_04000 [Patescibacteria group bacterium]|nr:hypothetical protein [Patescibacteria group bacterium]